MSKTTKALEGLYFHATTQHDLNEVRQSLEAFASELDEFKTAHDLALTAVRLLRVHLDALQEHVDTAARVSRSGFMGSADLQERVTAAGELVDAFIAAEEAK